MSASEARRSREIKRPRSRVLDAAILVACFSVLAAVAIPRQIFLSADVRRSDIDSLAASLSSAVNRANSLWIAAGQPAVLNMAGGEVALVHGYPSAATVSRVMEGPEMGAFRFAGGRWQHRDRSGGDACSVTYKPPSVRGALPQITVQRSGC